MNLIFIPFAYLKNAETSKNIRRNSNIVELYLKNAFVALRSLKMNSNADVSLITNFKLNEKYKSLFKKENIKIINCEYDTFRFPNYYPWCLTFYKFCALKKALELNYENFLMLDADVFCHKPIDNIFNACKEKLLILQKLTSTLPIINSIKKQYINLCENQERVYRCVGGIFASNKINALSFIDKCEFIFNQMIKNNVVSDAGDEFITSNAIAMIKNVSNEGEKFLRICWTGIYRDIPDINIISNVSILHVPAEKKYGMLKLFNFFMKHGSFPTDKKTFEILHIYKRSFSKQIMAIIKKYKIKLWKKS